MVAYSAIHTFTYPCSSIREEVNKHMATRRQKLRNVLVLADEADYTIADLLDSIEDFTGSGASGIENFLDGMLVTLTPPEPEDEPEDDIGALTRRGATAVILREVLRIVEGQAGNGVTGVLRKLRSI
jgi:hypothetical protein